MGDTWGKKLEERSSYQKVEWWEKKYGDKDKDNETETDTSIRIDNKINFNIQTK